LAGTPHPYDLLMADRYSLDEINVAFEAAHNRRATRAAIVLSSS
jgi:hypothetical protein